MKKIILLTIFAITLSGCSLNLNRDVLVNNQQQEIQKLNEKIETMANQLASSSEQIKEINNKQKESPQKIVMEKPVYIEKKEEPKSQPIQETAKQPENIVITASELAPYLTGTARVDCIKDTTVDNPETTVGSGSLWNITGVGYTVLTNRHVVDSIKPSDTSYCVLKVADANGIKADKNAQEYSSFWWLDMTNIMSWNNKTDVALFKITTDFVYGVAPTGLNYDIGSLPMCDKRMPLNSPVVAIGFPKTTWTYSKDGIMAYRTVTNGIISAHDESVTTEDNLPAPNYFVSAKIDSGNSGGIALSKDSKGLCVLGLPTWVNVGNFETAGMIQNIHNVFYKTN